MPTSSVLAAEKVSYHYDNLGSLRQINYPDSSGNAQYTFDAQGQLTKLKSGNNEWTYSYNNLGLLEQEALHLDNLSFIFQSLYNDAGHLTARLYPSGRAVSFSPNGFGQPTRVGSYATGAEYAASGQLLSFNYGNGLSFSQTLDAKFRPATRSVGSGTTLFAHTYSYDLNSNLLSLTDSLIPVNTITLSYDGLDRLTSADGAWGSGSFSYDALGNITNKTLGSEHINYHYNSAKRLTSVSGAHARSFNYDSRGNVTSNGARTFTYNRANRLTGSGGITYQYDGHGRRVSKTQGGTKTYSLYNQQGTLLATYRNGNYVEYYHLGQQLVARYNDAPQQADGLGYTGHLEDDDLELTYMQQRYYDPLIGRFYSNDPVGFTASNPMMFNRYAYGNNNPYKYTDPNGEHPVCLTPWAALACIGVAAAGYGVYKFGEKTENLKNSKLREMEADRLRQEAYISCVRSGGQDCGGISSLERELAERRKDTLKNAAEAVEAGCIVGTTCGGSIPSRTEENAVNGLVAIWNWLTGGDEQEEQKLPERPEPEKGN